MDSASENIPNALKMRWPIFDKNFRNLKFLQKTSNSNSLRKRYAKKCENYQNPT